MTRNHEREAVLERSARSRNRGALALLVAVLAGCASFDNIRVDLRPYAPEPGGAGVPAASPVKVRVEPVRDARKDAVGGLVGEKVTYGQAMGFIELKPEPVRMVADVLRAELAAAGCELVETGERFRVAARLVRFAVTTPNTAVYWDVTGDVEVQILVTGDGGGQFEATHAVHCTERTYSGPNEQNIATAVHACLAELGRKIRSDVALLRFLGGG